MGWWVGEEIGAEQLTDLIGFEPYEINHEESLLYERILERRVRSILKLVVGEDGYAEGQYIR